MAMSKKEAIKEGFEFVYYNPYHTRKDIMFFSFLTAVILFSLFFGFFRLTKVFLVINGAIALSLCIVQLIDFLSSEKIE